jgi:hypothetical protein
MKTKINNTKEVVEFAEQIINEGVSLHPDDDFNDMINYTTGEQIYSEKEAALRNELMNQCFMLCEKERADIYDLMNNVLRKKIGFPS